MVLTVATTHKESNPGKTRKHLEDVEPGEVQDLQTENSQKEHSTDKNDTKVQC